MLAEPANAALVGSGVGQERSASGAPAVSHPAFQPHPIQGWTPDFIPLVLQEALDAGAFDKVVPVPGPEGVATAQALARTEGILTGISGGATLAVALKLAAEAAPGSVILAMLPDTGERYLSTPLFQSIPEEMDAEETEISESTPGYRL